MDLRCNHNISGHSIFDPGWQITFFDMVPQIDRLNFYFPATLVCNCKFRYARNSHIVAHSCNYKRQSKHEGNSESHILHRWWMGICPIARYAYRHRSVTMRAIAPAIVDKELTSSTISNCDLYELVYAIGIGFVGYLQSLKLKARRI